MSLLGADYEIACAAAYFQHAIVVGQLGLPDEPVMDPLETRQAGQQVVAGQECVVAGGGNVVMWMMFKHRIHTALYLLLDNWAIFVRNWTIFSDVT